MTTTIAMTTPLSPLLVAFVAAMNAHDSDMLLACFTDNAVVYDEDREYHRAPAIREWSDAVFARYHVALDPIGIVVRDDETVLEVQVSGTFDGSPISFYYHFTLVSGKIGALRIGT